MTARRGCCTCLAVGVLLGLGSGCGGGEPRLPSDGTGNGTGGSALTAVLSGYLDGSGDEQVRDVALDAAGNLYITGGTSSDDFPVTEGALQTTHNPGTPDAASTAPFDVFVTKLSPDGAVIWSTFVGGPNYDRAYAIEVDGQGAVYIAGRAGRGFPVTSDAFQTTFMGGEEASVYGPQDGFLCKLRPDGAALIFCSYFGTGDPDIVRDLSVDGSGAIYLASARTRGRYPGPVEGAFINGPAGGRDAVAARVSSDGTGVLWARYLGGSGRESNENSVRLDGDGNPHFLVTTTSSDMETTPGVASRTYSGDGDLYIARLDPATGSLVWATYVGAGGNESTETHELAVSPAGDVYVATATQSESFPHPSDAFQRSYGGGLNDILVVHLDGAGRLEASSYLGGGAADRAEGVAVDDLGYVYFTGVTRSDDFPVTDDAFRSALDGPSDAIVAVLPPGLDRLVYASLLGGDAEDGGRGAAVGRTGEFLVGGDSRSEDWPRIGGAPVATGGGDHGVFTLFDVSIEP